MNELLPVLMILLPGAAVFLTRALPFLLFGSKRELPEAMKYLGGILPGAIMACLVVYCLKGAPAQGFSDNLALCGGVLSVVLLHLWKKNTLLSVFVGTVIYMILLQLL